MAISMNVVVFGAQCVGASRRRILLHQAGSSTGPMGFRQLGRIGPLTPCRRGDRSRFA
jgi:hypothetical protein